MISNGEPFSLEEAAIIANSPEAKAHIASAPALMLWHRAERILPAS